MKKQMCCGIFVILCAVTVVCLAQPKETTPEKRIRICGVGDGKWDFKMLRDPTGNVYGIPRRINALDNSGRIYVCDTLRNRILVYSLAGEQLTLIDGLPHPYSVQVGRDSSLLVSGVEGGKNRQWLGMMNDGDWSFEQLPSSREYLFYGDDGELADKSTDAAGMDLQLVDRKGQPTRTLPSKFADKRGIFFRKSGNGQTSILTIFSTQGKKLAEIGGIQGKLIQFQGYVFLLQRMGTRAVLLKYSVDGAVDKKIRFVGVPSNSVPLVSPNGKCLVFRERASDYSLWVSIFPTVIP